MPIRMVDDEQDNYSNENENTGGGGGGNFPGSGGGGGGLFQFLPMILGFLIRKPKLLIVALIIGAFFFLKGGCSGLSSITNNQSQLTTGGKLDPEEYKKAQVYEGLDETKNDLPEVVSLLKFAPDRKNQGQQGSCVAWSSAYGARSILQAASTGESPNGVACSPSFMYNQIGLEGCQGSYIIRAMENLTKVGAVPFNDFPYTDQDCSKQPDGSLMNKAQQYKMLGFTRLSGEEGTEKLDIHAIKEHLAKDVPVVIGMMVGGTFMQPMMGQDVWHPTDEDYNQMGFGGHAMCVIGYDDRKEGGAFQIMNSWGAEWGNNGIGFVKYNDFKHFVREAYGLNPMPKTGNAIATSLNCTFGLVDENKQYIPLKYSNSNVFTTVSPIKKMSKFKVEVKNNSACYVYVVGQETDGSSYVLFPYPSKANPQQTQFSPYCGITGYRLFPKGKSLQADEIGNKDFVAIITSNEALDIFAINNAITQNKAAGFGNAVNNAIQNKAASNVQFGNASAGTFGFQAQTTDKNTVAMILEINKQ
jgi:C1A family cysteine protease